MSPDDTQNEKRQLESRLIKLEVEIENHPEKAPFTKVQELIRVQAGQRKSLAQLEDEKEAIERKLKALDGSGATATRPVQYGELKEIVTKLVKRDGILVNSTVPSARIEAWIREYEKQGINLSASSIRKKLSDLGYSTEKTGEK